MKKFIGILLSLLMLVQLITVPAFATQKLSTPTGIRVYHDSDFDEDILTFEASTPSQYVDSYMFTFYVLSEGVLYDPGYSCSFEETELFVQDLQFDAEYVIEELENDLTLVNPKVVMNLTAISNDYSACQDSDTSIYFDLSGANVDSQIEYIGGGALTETATWKMSKDNVLYITGTGEVDLGWIPYSLVVEKIIFEEGITSCVTALYEYPKLREVYVYDDDFDWQYLDMGLSKNTVLYLPKSSPLFSALVEQDKQYSDTYGPAICDIENSDTYFRYTVDEKYVDAAKIVSDLGILNFVYVKKDDNVTKSQLAMAFARLEVRGLHLSQEDKYSDLEAGSFESGAAIEYENELLPESGTVYGKDEEITYQNILDIINGHFPEATVSLDGKETDDTVTYQELAYILNQLMTADYLMNGTESTLYVFHGSISDVYCDPDNSYQYYGLLNGTLEGEFMIEGEEIVENYDALIMDYDGMNLTSDDEITLYIVYNEVRTGVLSTYDIEREDSTGYSASFTINNGEEETSSKNVTLQLSAEGYTKYKIGDGSYKNIRNSVSYTLEPTHGTQSISVTFANADETKTKTVTRSIKLNNLRTITYKVGNTAWKTVQVGCGLDIPDLGEAPEMTGKVFQGWIGLPDVMPDNDITVTAEFTDIPPVGTGSCGDSATWTLLQDGTLSITGTGAIESYPDYADREYRDLIKKVVIGSGITEIGDYALYELFELEEISIPDTVTSIGEGFVKGSKVTEVTIPASVQTIKMQMSFVKCTALEKIVFLSKDTILDDASATELVSGVEICGYSDSDAERFAEENNCPFQETDPDFVINDRAAETDNATVTLTFNDYAASFEKFKINDGQWKNIAETATFTVDKNDGEKTISVAFKKGNLEIVKTHSIVYNNKHNIVYKVNGEAYKTVIVGCGAQTSIIEDVPVVAGYSFIRWDDIPEVMPDADVVCNAVLAELPGSEALQGILTEEEINDGYSVNTQIAVTTASDSMQQEIENNSTYTAALILDIKLEKVKEGEEAVGIPETSDLIAFSVDIPAVVQGNFSYMVLREHGGNVDTLTTVANENGEYISISNNKLTIYANRFSAYTLLAKEIVRKTSSGGGSSLCNVKFETNGGNAVNSQTIGKNTIAKAPATPVKEGFVFDGWYTDKELTVKFDFTEKITKSITLYAKWKEAVRKEIVLTVGQSDVLINGLTKSNDVEPFIVNDRVVLPIRLIAEELGAKVGWNGETKTVTVESGDTIIIVEIGKDKATVNGKEVILDCAAFIQKDRTFLPIRFVMENLGADVLWDEVARTVTIVK